jgi:hypothetical protein
MYRLKRVPTKYETSAAMPPIINVIRPDFRGDFFTTLPVMKPMQKKDNAVKIIE